jgi:phosphohistidine swiveling domain-containing protein
MKNFSEIKNIIQKYGLKPASQRELPLLTLSCIAKGYTLLLRGSLGFSYEAIAAIGGKGKFHTLLNEEHVAKETGSFVEKNKKKIEKIAFVKAKQIYSDISSKMEELDILLKNNPKKCLETIIGFYPAYMLSIGIYNCFWRYIGNDVNKSNLSSADIEKISIDRDKIAKIYPQIEETIKKSCQLIGEQKKIDGDLLRYFTFDEINHFFKEDNLKKKTLKELTLRREGYFYTYVENKSEEIILNKTTISRIKEQFFSVENTGIKEIKGFVAFKGNAKGGVYNLQNHNLSDSGKFKDGDILVTSMTHPKDIMLIKKSSGIITDEGGILCHAAIVSRELKKPCIIGTKIATKILNDGDIVSINGDSGIIQILK